MQASSGGYHTVLLRSDGEPIIVGNDKFGQCSVPSVLGSQSWLHWVFTKPVLPEGVEYVPDFTELPVRSFDALESESIGDMMVQVSAQVDGEVCHVQCLSLAGNVLAEFDTPLGAAIGMVHKMMIDKLGMEYWRLQAVLHSGRLVKQCRRHERFIDLAVCPESMNGGVY